MRTNKIYNRELSWLQFNERVLQEAQDKRIPLIQRLRFLGIFSNNQDEFIRVRVGNLIRYMDFKGNDRKLMSGSLSPCELLPLVNESVENSQKKFRKIYSDIISEMRGHNIFVVNESELSDSQIQFCREYFFSVISVRLVPLMLRKSVKIPFLPDGKIYLSVKMSTSRSKRYAIIQIPVSERCPRFIVLPSLAGRIDVIFLDDIIRLFLDEIFFMFKYDRIEAYTFKLVRDAEMTFDDDVSKSMSEKMIKGLMKRAHGKPIRLVYDSQTPEDILVELSKKMGLRKKEELEAGGRYHQMSDLMKFPKIDNTLEYENRQPLLHPRIDPFNSIMDVIRKQDILLCYPYHTFKHFIDLLREAAVDPKVHSISITLYRTALHSKVIGTLINAAKNGKSVTALVELKARFDEEQNIDNTDILQQGGVRVIHSQEGLKIHSKLMLIKRIEARGELRGYAYIGTGNFNEKTAQIYSDFGLLTSDQRVVRDASALFDFFENTYKHPTFEKLMVSPYFMRSQIEEIIEGEILNAGKRKKAYFYAKLNSLTDEKMINLLYRASCAGVKIRLIVRGACCLEAGIRGLSENIEVHSIIDKYLEHARMIIACNGGKPRSYIMSADFMTRNLDRRVEVGIQITNKTNHNTLVDYFNIQWKDNEKARLILPPYENKYVSGNGESRRSQEELYDYFKQKN